jgi:mannose-6-phosphate isomerase-like protein (cupin superfamily)
MSLHTRTIGLIVAVITAAPVFAQAPPTPATPAPAPAQRAARPPQPAAITVIVRNPSGNPIEGVTITVSGAQAQEAQTDAAGTAKLSLLEGAYRLEFDRDGFITLDRELAVKRGQPASELDVVLRMAPPPPPPPEPPPPPPPAPVPASGPPITISIPSFLDKNIIRGEPLKESILACAPDGIVRLLQIRDRLAEHSHADMDEVLYVVAGEGTVRAKGEPTDITAGSLSVMPRGVVHSIDRRGRNPLILISTLAGGPCPAGAAVAQSQTGQK